jgi:hypothetical protein
MITQHKAPERDRTVTRKPSHNTDDKLMRAKPVHEMTPEEIAARDQKRLKEVRAGHDYAATRADRRAGVPAEALRPSKTERKLAARVAPLARDQARPFPGVLVGLDFSENPPPVGGAATVIATLYNQACGWTPAFSNKQTAVIRGVRVTITGEGRYLHLNVRTREAWLSDTESWAPEVEVYDVYDPFEIHLTGF